MGTDTLENFLTRKIEGTQIKVIIPKYEIKEISRGNSEKNRNKR